MNERVNLHAVACQRNFETFYIHWIFSRNV